MTTKEQVIQAARDCGMDVVDDEYSLLPFLERIYNLAYKAGEKAMQERAAKVCDEQYQRSENSSLNAKRVTDAKLYHQCAVTAQWNSIAIRALEV